jgi:hypothetical protein
MQDHSSRSPEGDEEIRDASAGCAVVTVSGDLRDALRPLLLSAADGLGEFMLGVRLLLDGRAS